MMASQKFEGGVFKAKLEFPEDYPFQPPKMTFVSDFWHPNVYENGNVCISILHPAGNDPMSGERPEERWSPAQSPETILLSVISMLSDPNLSSPANVDAGVEFRKERKKYRERCLALVKKSMKELPEDYISSKELVQSMKKKTPMQSPQFDLDFVEDDYIYDPDEDDYQIYDNEEDEEFYDDEEEYQEEDEEEEEEDKIVEKIET
eukprot:gene10962-3670_t